MWRSVMAVHLLQNKLEKKSFFKKKKIFVLFTKYVLFAEKNIFYTKNKKTYVKIYIKCKIYFYTENVCVPYKNINLFKYTYTRSLKNVFDHKKYFCDIFVGNSISGP